TVRQQYTTQYWDRYRATPKAYITLDAGQKLWASRFGALTSIRLAPPESLPLDKAAKRFEGELLAQLSPEEGGFVFDEVKVESLKASTGGTPFGLLFLGFSFFLIAAALLLVGLLFRLNLDRRAEQVGVLFAEGFSLRVVRRLLLGEGAILAVGGAIA